MSCKLALNQLLQLFGLGALLFIPNSNLGWQAGWIFFVVFSTSTLTLNFFLFKRYPTLLNRRLKIGPRAEANTMQKFIQLLAFLLFAVTVATASLDNRFSWSPIASWEIALGNALVVGSFLFRLFVFRTNESASATIEINPKQIVIDSGPYALVRHHMY